MSLFKRAINIIKSNINADKASGINFDDIDLSSFSQSEQSFYEQSSYEETSFKTEDVLSPDEKKEQEYYGNLELPVGASFEQIRKQYRLLLKKYHPDKFNNNENKRKLAEQVVSKLNNAYNYFENKYKT